MDTSGDCENGSFLNQSNDTAPVRPSRRMASKSAASILGRPINGKELEVTPKLDGPSVMGVMVSTVHVLQLYTPITCS